MNHKKTISLCMIAKNEAATIGQCLNSVLKYVDEIILVDTGSTDSTREIAKSFGAKIIEEEWQNDFSLHRNTSLKKATGDWILFLDCDEELLSESGQKLRKVIENGSFEGFQVQVINKLQNKEEVTFPSIRLFKNRDCFRFRGRIHEQIVYAILDNYGPKSIGRTDITIIHHGYNYNKTNIKAKIQRNLKILQNYSEEEKDGFYLYNLGTEYLRSGDNDKALEIYKKSLELTKPNNGYASFLIKKIITMLIDKQRYLEAVTYSQYYQKIFPGFKDLYFLEGIAYLNSGYFSKAYKCIKNYQQTENENKFFPSQKKYQGITAEDFKQKIKPFMVINDLPSLSVCIIGKDEEKTLVNCIKSVNEIAEEVIYLDTGSTDNSCELAYQMGAKIYKSRWINDFSLMKNIMIEKADGEWILIIDADEILPDLSRNKIPQLIKETKYTAFQFKIHTFLTKELSIFDCFTMNMVRLFKNNNYHFQGKIKEEIAPLILGNGGKICQTDLVINHLHFTANKEQLAAKRKVKLAVIEDSSNNKIQKDYYRGIEYFFACDFHLACNYFAQCTSNLENDIPADLFYLYALSLINLKKIKQAVKVLEKGCRQYTDYTDLFYLFGLTHYLQEKFINAECLFKKCLEIGEKNCINYIHTPGTGNFKALASLATIYNHTGKIREALFCYLKLAQNPFTFKQGIEGITQLHIRTKKSNELVNFFQKHDLLTAKSLSIAAQKFAENQLFIEALEYVRLAYEDLIKEDFKNLAQFTNTINLILEYYK